MSVCAYQGVRKLTTALAPYTVPLTGVSHPGYFVGLVGSNGAWGQNPDTYLLETMPNGMRYSPIFNMDAQGTTPTAGYNFTLYKLTPSALETWHFTGTAGNAGPTDVNAITGAFNLFISGDNHATLYAGLNAGPSMEYSRFDVSTPTNFTGVQASTIQSGSPLVGLSNPICYAGIDTDGNYVQIFASFEFVDGQEQYWASSDLSDAINPFLCPTTGTTFPSGISVNAANKTCRLLIENIFTTPDTLKYIDFTVANSGGNRAITFGGDNIVTVDQNATHEICEAMGTNFPSSAKFFPELDAWIVRGTALSGSSGWYLISSDLSKYWNLQFGLGPDDFQYGPVADSLSNIYFVDDSNGNVYVSTLNPTPPPVSGNTPINISRIPPFQAPGCAGFLHPSNVC